MNNVCFIHICTIGNFQHVVDEIFDYIKKSFLYKELECIYINIAGNENVCLPNLENIYVFPYRSNINEFEISTLKLMQSFCKTNKSNVLYIHTKGVSSTNNICIDEWRQYMLYFNITKYKDALKMLVNNDAVGVDLVTEPVLHFSGNMWWSKSNHINLLNDFSDLPVIISERHKAEFWITSKNNGNYFSLHDSKINVYQRHLTRYKKENY